MTDLQKVIKYLAMALAILLIVAIFGGIISGLSVLSFIFDDNSDTNITGSDSQYVTQTFSNNIKKLDIEIAAADFQIKEGETFSIESNHKYLDVKEGRETLEINETKRPWNTNHKDYSVVLYIPDGTSFESVKIETGAGSVGISKLTTDELELDLGAGEVRISDITVSTKADIDGGAGKLTVSYAEFANLDLDIGVGESTLTTLLSGNSDIDCGVGTTTLNLIGDAQSDYKISVDKGIGDVTVDEEKVKNSQIIGNGNAFVDISCGVGEVNVKFINK